MATSSGILQRTSVEVPVFIGGNIYSSRQMVPPGQPITKLVPLPRLNPDEDLCGENICIKATTPVKLDTFCPIFQPGSQVTTTCFDRRFAYYQLDAFIDFLRQGVKFDVNLVYSRIRHMPGYTIPVYVNEPNLENAFFDPTNGTLTFGDGKNKWHFASDGDILVHEAGHLIVHLINPTLSEDFYSAGPAIHEGVADVLAAIFFKDPEIAEDSGIWQSGAPTKDGLRSVANNSRLQALKTAEPHEVGKIYGRFFWSMYQRILAKLGNKNPAMKTIAQILATQIILTHLGNYKVPNPTHSDFLDAVKAGIAQLKKYGQLGVSSLYGVDADFLLEAAEAESILCGFDWITKKKEEELPEEASFPDAVLDEPVLLGNFLGERRVARKQFYKSSAHGKVLMLGQGYISPLNDQDIHKEFTQGLRRIKPNEIDEQVRVPQNTAFATASKKLDSWQPKNLRPAMRQRLVFAAKLALAEKRAAARLAIPFKASSLAWHITASSLEIIIDAKNGRLISVRNKLVVD